MIHSQIIKRAILSEKSYKQIDNGLYTFLVDKKSTKEDIAKAVEKQFSVTVKGVNVLNKIGKMKRINRTRKTTMVGGGKKAIVTLAKGQSIAMFTTEKDKTKSKKTEKKVEGSKINIISEKGKGLLNKLRKKKDEKDK